MSTQSTFKKAFKYMCTTHFWGPVSNFGIPVAAIMDLKKDPDLISGPMTGSLILYSLVFMRYSMAVTPKNYLLFGCHLVNEIAQLGQGYRWVSYHYSDEGKAKDKAEREAEAAKKALGATKS
ncbi:pyruvate transporter mpc1 [Lodderomyces elongisporus]|uniref:pyruvate transporter mpc1 n=1 Tax=Lodderomyces elongisporus TaxID=36914 RepID=UPI00292075C8|nr:pyruvate transporter mpc1 [Lodderomyces elongisporus]WLF78313.1 pyruvate transporter mpc1 [Lodderomyces elongisporus]